MNASRFAAGLIATVAALAAPPSLAQDDAAPGSAPRFELTPYAAYRFGGDFERADDAGAFDLRDSDAQGLIFNFRARDANGQWQVLYARQNTRAKVQPGGTSLDVDAEYLHFGGVYLFDGTSTRPFVALTAGIAHFAPGPHDLEAESYLSGSIGGGVQLRADKRIGVRLEARMFLSLITDDSDLFCDSRQNGCAINLDSKAFIQWEALAGVVFRF